MFCVYDSHPVCSDERNIATNMHIHYSQPSILAELEQIMESYYTFLTEIL